MKSAGIRRTLVALAALCTFLLAAAPAMAGKSAEENAPASLVFDAMFLRPIGIVITGIGTGMFAASLPLVLITSPRDVGKPFNILVKRPIRYVWADPIGSH